MCVEHNHTGKMKVFLLLGLVAVALCEPTKFVGDKVLRLKPLNDEHVTIIRELGQKVKVDFWRPDSSDLVSTGMNVDIHVPAAGLDMVFTILQQSGMEAKVMFEDLQEAVEAQMDNMRVTKAHDYTKYNSWATINDWVVSISSANANLISRQVIGNTYEGRPMHLLKIGKKTGSAKPAVFMDCGFHAREWITHAFCQWFVNEAVSTYGSDPEMTNLLDRMDFFVLPVFNIDGYEYTWTKDRMWRKTRSRNSGSSCIGADPNRNFDAGWCTTGASSNPCSDTYCGSSPESEIESKNLANFIRTNKSIIKAYLTVHSYSQLLLFPYSYKYGLAADHSELLSVSQGAIAALRSLYGTRYTSGPGATTIYPAAGGSDDWAYDLGVKYSYTFELRDEGRYGFLLPESQIKPTCEETMLAVKYIASYVLNNLY
ncbi:carboxypeptidase B [Chanodichthys erythropterus]|uniref:carboxypeptidase B n=1 Tax=Chanodichthys erythropterus TaxID=933992 RepID=UPI00351F27C2